ncbi:MAG: hypothetical protein JWO90_2168 [Solirubrobacterales bacterium]|nr:hypothetical protein [Solirubrobacterales bacterium]
MRNSQTTGRIAALAAFLLATALVAVALLGGGGADFVVTARFQSAAQLVTGNLVQVAGRPVGEVRRIGLTDDGQAEVELHITDADYAPLRRGTQATIRQASLSGVANRYVDLRLPPGGASAMEEGAVITQADTTTAVDLDQLFNVFDPEARRSLQGLIKGQATSYGGTAEDANAGFLYLNPSLAATSRLFAELNRDTPLLRRFIDASSTLVTDVAERRTDLTGLVANLADTTGAIADRRSELDDALTQLPPFMRRANTTFVNLRATLDDLGPLVTDSKPVARRLRPFLAELRPLARDARPTLRDLSRLVRSPGADDDLIDLNRSAPGVADAATKRVTANGRERESTFAAAARALGTAAPQIGFIRPYSADLTGWFDDFGHSGLVDALGGASRAAPHVNAFATVNSVAGGLLSMTPLLTPEAQQANLAKAASLNQRNRCPGAAERGAAYRPTPTYNCDPTQVPLGP